MAFIPFMVFSLSRRLLTPLAIALILAMTTGCSPRTSNVESGNASSTLHLAIGAEPRDLDPHLVTAYTDFQVVLALFEGLTAVDEQTSRPVPSSAERWETSADGLTWTFHLRPDLKWSDGVPLTAQTFRDSFARALAPTIASEYAYVLYPIKNAARFNAGELPDFVAVGVKAVDATTLTIELERPTPTLPSILTLPVSWPVPVHVLNRQGGFIDRNNRWTRPENIVSNGPFRLTEWSPDQRLLAERNPHYYADAQTKLNGLAFYPYENAASQETAFRAGQLHLTSEMPLTKIATYRAEHPESLRIDPFLLTGFIRFNLTHPPFDDLRVRRALSLAINRVALAEHVLTGGELPAHSLTPPNTAGYQAVTQINYDPEQARQLLADAGFPLGQNFPVVEVISPARQINQQLLEAIQQMWRRELGIEVQLALKEQRVWLDDETQLHYELSNGRWIGDYVDPYTFLELFYSFSGNNNTGWKNPDYDRLLQAASAEADETRRHALYQQAETILLQDSPIAPLYHGTQAYLIRPEVNGWPPTLLGLHRYQFVSLEP
jgi:oligopeptide transport system substrate-binding protein